jgi:hypothetical protein
LSAFKSTGIQPYNRFIFGPKDFAANHFLDMPETVVSAPTLEAAAVSAPTMEAAAVSAPTMEDTFLVPSMEAAVSAPTLEVAVAAPLLEAVAVSATMMENAFLVPSLEAAVSAPKLDADVSELLKTPPQLSIGLNEGVATLSTSASVQGN